MNIDKANQLFEKFEKTNVLLLGDGMIDAYMWGEVHRQSPEAPVPVVDVYKRESRLGGAGNVAKNLKSLGAQVTFCGFVGEDDNGFVFRDLLKKNQLTDEGLFVTKGRPTTVKTRIIASNKHVLRVDEEETSDLDDYSLFIDHVVNLIEKGNFDVLIFQDYNKGVLSKVVIEEVINVCRQKGIPTIVDPKKKNFLEYKGVTLFKPNLKEIKEGLDIKFNEKDINEVIKASSLLKTILKADIILLTMSERGVFITSGDHKELIPAFEREIVDVSGAGDTVLSVAALSLAAGLDLSHIALLSNLAGGLVCEEVGVVPIIRESLFQEVRKNL